MPNNVEDDKKKKQAASSGVETASRVSTPTAITNPAILTDPTKELGDAPPSPAMQPVNMPVLGAPTPGVPTANLSTVTANHEANHAKNGMNQLVNSLPNPPATNGLPANLDYQDPYLSEIMRQQQQQILRQQGELMRLQQDGNELRDFKKNPIEDKNGRLKSAGAEVLRKLGENFGSSPVNGWGDFGGRAVNAASAGVGAAFFPGIDELRSRNNNIAKNDASIKQNRSTLDGQIKDYGTFSEDARRVSQSSNDRAKTGIAGIRAQTDQQYKNDRINLGYKTANDLKVFRDAQNDLRERGLDQNDTRVALLEKQIEETIRHNKENEADQDQNRDSRKIVAEILAGSRKEIAQMNNSTRVTVANITQSGANSRNNTDNATRQTLAGDSAKTKQKVNVAGVSAYAQKQGMTLEEAKKEFESAGYEVLQ